MAWRRFHRLPRSGIGEPIGAYNLYFNAWFFVRKSAALRIASAECLHLLLISGQTWEETRQKLGAFAASF
jgi:hypothetical protein